jgi:periplasmic nitrate reductase NapD
MNIASVVVATKPENLAQVKKEIQTLTWAVVHHTDEAGRLIVTIEGETSEKDVERYKFIRSIPDVLNVELIQYTFEEDGELPDDPSEFESESDEVPDYLQNDDLDEVGINHFQKSRRLSNF